MVSLNPPLWAFVSGVRVASVMTTSSGFLVVLEEDCQRLVLCDSVMESKLHAEKTRVAAAYIADNALVEGAICDTMDLRRSVMLKCDGED